MVIVKFILLLILGSFRVHAGQVEDAFKNKNYKLVTSLYRDAPEKNYNKKELIYISYSLRKMGFHRQDIKLNIKLIRQHYLKHHKKLLRSLKESETIDGDDYPKALKVLYWNLFTDYGIILESYKELSVYIKKDQQHFNVFSKLLSELEFREGQVDKYNDRFLAHLQNLENKIYRFSSSLSLQYVSWQQESILKGPADSSGLVVTNSGVCAGGDVGVENFSYHFYLDGCLLMGKGSVEAASTASVEYQQSNVPAFGLKIGPGASMIVSSSRSRIGIKLPIIYTLQKLQDPKEAEYSIEEESPINLVPTLYSRWQFDRWYFQTEFGKYLQREATFWGLGIGRSF